MQATRFPDVSVDVSADVSAFRRVLNGVDWSSSPLGDPAAWPPGLRAHVHMMLDTRVPMAIVWGPRDALLYNAAYAPFLGDQHPWALGRPLGEVGPRAWPLNWPKLAPLIARARGGEALHLEDVEVPAERGGHGGPAWFTFFHSPLRDEHGVLSGVCSTAVDTTARVRAEQDIRRLNQTLEARVAAATAELRHSEAHLQSLFGQTAAGIAETDLDFHIIRANRKFCDIVGRPERDLLGLPLERLVHPEDIDENTRLLMRMLDNGEPFDIENRYLRPDGSEVWVSKMVTPIVEPGAAQPTSILAIVIDITRRRQAESQLRANAERLRLATEAARLGIWSWGVADENPYLENERLYEMVGLARGEAPVDTVRLLTQLVHPDDIAPYQAAMAHTLATGEPFRYEGRFYRASDRALRWFEFTGALHRDASSQPLRMVGTAADVTERKEMHEKLRLREERYRTLLDAIDEGFCVIQLVCDEDGAVIDHRFLEANPAFTRHTGLHDVVGKTARELAPGIEPLRNDVYLRVADSGEPVRLIQHSAALGRWFDVFAARAESEARDKVAVVFRDITEQRRAEEELRKLAADLSKANQRQNEFLATLAHELRNPLAPIKTGLDLMRMSPGNAAALTKVRDMMERQVNHLIHLVNDLLDLARVQSGKVELKKARIVLQDIVASAVETALPLIQSRRHTFEQQLPPAPLELNADAHRLAQVIGNLLTNAAKYTPPGGRIVLAVTREADEASGTPLAVVRVSDNGIGIPADALPLLFEMFNQGRNGLDYAQGGLGIGLNLVRRLTQKHGGSVSATSPGPGQGSTFTVRLPLAAQTRQTPAASPRHAPAQAPVQAAPLRILVADDNTDAAALLAQLLRAQGHAVRVVQDGKAALEAACAEPPDLALLDIGMPGMTGYELARALRRLSALDGTVLAAVTGWGTQDDRKRSREAGFDHHMTKPIDLDSLNRLLAGIQGRERADQ